MKENRGCNFLGKVKGVLHNIIFLMEGSEKGKRER